MNLKKSKSDSVNMTYDIPSFWDAAALGIAGGIIFLLAAIAAVIISFRKIRVELWAVAAALIFVSIFSVGLSIQLYHNLVSETTISQTQEYLAEEYGTSFSKDELLSLMNYQNSGRPGQGALLANQFEANSPDHVENMVYGTTDQIVDGKLVHFQLAKVDDSLKLFTSFTSVTLYKVAE